MRTLTATLTEECLALLPPTLFFVLMLHLVAVIRALMLQGTGIARRTSWQGALRALLLGKAVLVAGLLPWITRYPHKPLVSPIAWKTLIDVLVALLVHSLEHLVECWRATGSLVAGNQRVLAEIVWPHFWATQLLLGVLILLYCTLRSRWLCS